MRQGYIAKAVALCCVAAAVAAIGSPLAAEDKKEDDKLVERQINVAGLVNSTAAAEALISLCVEMIEPASWEQAGGKGTIKVGRRLMIVNNTQTAGDLARRLVAVLAKLPPFDEKSAVTTPKTARIDVATLSPAADKADNKNAGRRGGPKDAAKPVPATILAVYPVADLAWADDKSPPDFDNLVYMIETCVASRSWAENGGEGAIAAFAARGALVVRNSSHILAEVDSALAALRKLPRVSETEKNAAAIQTVPLGKGLGSKGDAEARLYHVTDLALAGGSFANYNPIMQRLMDHAAAESWQRNGGEGMILRLHHRGGLAIVNTAQAHGAVEAELAKMRSELATSKEKTPAGREKRRAQ